MMTPYVWKLRSRHFERSGVPGGFAWQGAWFLELWDRRAEGEARVIGGMTVGTGWRNVPTYDSGPHWEFTSSWDDTGLGVFFVNGLRVREVAAAFAGRRGLKGVSRGAIRAVERELEDARRRWDFGYDAEGPFRWVKLSQHAAWSRLCGRMLDVEAEKMGHAVHPVADIAGLAPIR